MLYLRDYFHRQFSGERTPEEIGISKEVFDALVANTQEQDWVNLSSEVSPKKGTCSKDSESGASDIAMDHLQSAHDSMDMTCKALRNTAIDMRKRQIDPESTAGTLMKRTLDLVGLMEKDYICKMGDALHAADVAL